MAPDFVLAQTLSGCAHRRQSQAYRQTAQFRDGEFKLRAIRSDDVAGDCAVVEGLGAFGGDQPQRPCEVRIAQDLARGLRRGGAGPDCPGPRLLWPDGKIGLKMQKIVARTDQAVLLANHGLVAVGPTLSKAFAVAEEIADILAGKLAELPSKLQVADPTERLRHWLVRMQAGNEIPGPGPED